jgi:hypothetical protein
LFDQLPTLGLLESIALDSAHATPVCFNFYLAKGGPFLLLHVEFEDGLSVLIQQNRITQHKSFNWKS